jgi:hypothetical protein
MNADRIVNKLLEADGDDLTDEVNAMPETAVQMIYAAYGTTDPDEIYAEAASRREGSRHEEVQLGTLSDTVVCNICGALSVHEPDAPLKPGSPDPIYHPECYL